MHDYFYCFLIRIENDKNKKKLVGIYDLLEAWAVTLCCVCSSSFSCWAQNFDSNNETTKIFGGFNRNEKQNPLLIPENI